MLTAYNIHSRTVKKVTFQNEIEEKTLISDNTWELPASEIAKSTVNPIRQICDSLFVASNTKKPPLKLNLGDPTVSGALPVCSTAIQAISEALISRKYEGYGPAVGNLPL